MERDRCKTMYCRKPVSVFVRDADKVPVGYCEECNAKRLEDQSRAWVAEHPGFELEDGLIKRSVQ
jgi:hypothetical protein